jgi:hypothetical protein
MPPHASSDLTTCSLNPLLPNVKEICDAQCDAQNAECHLIIAALTQPSFNKSQSAADLAPKG